jgi:hypothetical protein
VPSLFAATQENGCVAPADWMLTRVDDSLRAPCLFGASGDLVKGVALLPPHSLAASWGKSRCARFFRARRPLGNVHLWKNSLIWNFRAWSEAGLIRSFGFSVRLD